MSRCFFQNENTRSKGLEPGVQVFLGSVLIKYQNKDRIHVDAGG